MPRDDASLVFDDNQRDGPGLHAFLIGVSRYPKLKFGDDEASETFGLEQLSSPACTVKAMADTLLTNADNLRPKLKTLRVLASPSAQEAELSAPGDRGRQGLKLKDLLPATLEQMRRAAKRWRQDASLRIDDATLFYFAGHGIRLSRGEAILLLEDFLDGDGATILERSINLNNIYNGMGSPSLPNMAQTQFYVIDACRSTVGKLKNYLDMAAAPVFEMEARGTDDRIAPIFYAAAEGRVTYGTPGGLSLFGRDFKSCLEGRAGECVINGEGSVWVLTVNELVRVLSEYVRKANEIAGAKLRSFQIDKFDASVRTDLRILNGPPLVHCNFMVRPDEAHKVTTPVLTTSARRSAYAFPNPITYPYPCEVPAGRYVVEASVNGNHSTADFAHDAEFVEIRAPSFDYTFIMRR